MPFTKVPQEGSGLGFTEGTRLKKQGPAVAAEKHITGFRGDVLGISDVGTAIWS